MMPPIEFIQFIIQVKAQINPCWIILIIGALLGLGLLRAVRKKG